MYFGRTTLQHQSNTRREVCALGPKLFKPIQSTSIVGEKKFEYNVGGKEKRIGLFYFFHPLISVENQAHSLG